MSRPGAFLVTASVALLAACAARPPIVESCEARAMAMKACMPVQELAEWESVDDSTLLLWAPGAARAYLVRLTRPIDHLTSLEEVEIADGDLDGLICGCGRDGVIDMFSGSSARIGWVEHLTEQRTAELLSPPSTIL